MQLFEHPYARFLHKVAKPTRYTGAEHGVRRKDWAAVQARICLAFPDIYDIGMSHLGFRILYRLLNDDERTLAERAYTPWTDMQRELKNHGQLLVSLESGRPLCDFDVIGFSLQYELTYTNILTMLDLGGVPLRSEHRSDDDPLVIAGGPVATHAEPIAMFIDAFLIGDGEEAAAEIALAWTEGKRAGLPREQRLKRLASIRGVYVPSLYGTAVDASSGLEVVQKPAEPGVPFPVERRLVEDLSRFPFPDDGPVGGPEAIFDRMSIEVARGCTEGCRFCQAGMIYRPVRERDPEEVISTVLRALEKSGQDEVSLTALSTADVSCISPMIKRLVEKTAPERVSLGVASLRAYGLGEDLLDDMRKVRASGLTFAPEAGTQRMRDVINKNVTEEQLLETAQRVFSRGFDKMKLYFIIGLPTEQDEDVLGIASVGKNALGVGRRVGRNPRVTVSVSVHVPKPHTPFQWCAMDPIDEVERKQGLLRDALRSSKGIQLRTHDATTSVLEGVLARGDRRLGPVIERAFLAGARFDSWEDQLRLELWKEALGHFGIDIQLYLGTIPVTARVPWDHLDIGLEQGFLAREYRKALAGRLSPPCGKVAGTFIHHTNVADAQADQRRLVCYDCGIACDLGAMRSDRIDGLARLGANEPSDRARLPVLPAERPDRPELQKKHPEFHRPVRSGGPPVKMRLRFEKTGPAALLGHLDLIRELPRVIKRAGGRVAYSEGFHPKPDLSFGPALSLGVASLDEYVDVKLIDPPSAEELLGRLKLAASGGLRFLEARLVPNKEPSITAVVTGGSYVIAFAESSLDEFGGRAGLAKLIDAFLEKSEHRVRRNVEGLGKLVDVRAFTRSLALGDDAAYAALDGAGVVGRLVPIVATIKIGPSGSAKIAELVEAIVGRSGFPHQAVRIALHTEAGSLWPAPAPQASPLLVADQA
ncbi:MAG TPA: TIGR03960 family B12-binding radical SAM protein [Polyangiaceae bacterium]|nr:TIGR03960 family B12-binding radical SAM protein [Polyangiaceae bacterium]